MGGISTQSRTYLFNRDSRCETWYNGYDLQANDRRDVIKQETTSYRSRRRGEDTDESVSDLLSKYSRNYGIPLTDSGHEFSTYKQGMKLSHGHVEQTDDFTYPSGSYLRYAYHGPLSADVGEYNANLAGLPANVPVNAKGASFVNQTLPTKSVASLGQAVAELKDGLPSIIGRLALKRNFSPKAISEEYINYQFGIAPLIGDLLKCAKAVLNSKQIIDQYVRDSGLAVRRRRSEPWTTDVQTYSYEGGDINPFNFPIQVGPGSAGFVIGNVIRSNGGNPGFTRVDRTITTKSRYSFSGSYMYYLADGDKLTDKFTAYEQLANKLLGTTLTLDTLWQLAPWSWLADWFSDIGDVISNSAAFSRDSLVMRYGYLMLERHYEVSYTGFGFSFRRDSDLVPITTTYNSVSKQRWRANPYGFGLTQDALSDAQWSILAALGLTKGPRKLRFFS
jgi:hypothetical protein